MVANKRITDLTDYTNVLPYASELFGVYQPMLGWRSRRTLQRYSSGARPQQQLLIDKIGRRFAGRARVEFNADYQLDGAEIGIGEESPPGLRVGGSGILTSIIAQSIRDAGLVPRGAEWLERINPGELESILNGPVLDAHSAAHHVRFMAAADAPGPFNADPVLAETRRLIDRESATAGMLIALADRGMFDELSHMLLGGLDATSSTEEFDMAAAIGDPLLAFDPTKQLGDVSVSPVGIVHLFRQYFFELDSFIGTPVGHVWLSPGSTVELIEVSTRKTLVERVIETSLETIRKSESSVTEQDEIADAVKDENKSDMKLGFTTTVNQSWGTGNASATSSINLDKTQSVAREQSHKRMRQQSEKLSTEIRQNFKSTFRTLTETVDTSSKRYVLNNTSTDLVNYELRRKMRQVGVQVQDIGSYLCWETFVDNLGDQLALPNLIHIAKPADLVLVPDPNEIPMPPASLMTTFTGEMVWNYPENNSQHGEHHPEVKGRFVPLNTIDIPGIPNDYEVDLNPSDPFIPIEKSVIAADDDDSWDANNWYAMGMITPDARRVIVGIATAPLPDGLAWDDRITFKVSGGIKLRLKPQKRAEIDAANSAIRTAANAATAENKRRSEEAYLAAVNERVTLASKIRARRFEDLRQEERTIVYRNLISELMTDQLYQNLPESTGGYEMRHVMSELLNSIFDIDKMLYFVAPEWWKPKNLPQRGRLMLGGVALNDSLEGSVVRWADDAAHQKYFITEGSDPAPLGSSLGWLMQLDGDDQRNAFLNAPWVKAVIPIRPGKEQAALNWLQTVKVEGSDGLDSDYIAPQDELDAIKAALLANDPGDPVGDHARVSIADALRHLCLTVAAKHSASVTPGRFPDDPSINDDNKVSATPVEKVFEHGFYPLKDGFRAITSEPFEVFDQWVEVLPTDQVVPVEVTYNPLTGRQVAP
jgi:hypothetical protein